MKFLRTENFLIGAGIFFHKAAGFFRNCRGLLMFLSISSLIIISFIFCFNHYLTIMEINSELMKKVYYLERQLDSHRGVLEVAKGLLRKKVLEIEEIEQTLEKLITPLQEKVIAQSQEIRSKRQGIIKETHMREVVKAVLEYLGVYSKDFEELLIFTVAVESEMGRALRDPSSTTFGAFQILPSTEAYIVDNWLWTTKGSPYRDKVLALQARGRDNASLQSSVIPKVPQIMTDLQWQVAVATCLYLMRVGTDGIPAKDNLDAISRVYKIHYNSILGAATHGGSIRRYNSLLNQPLQRK